ncbi:hypothetical protein TRIUR3_22943 [Triticum urartu]|uniref:Uncharacterized protein n=1 Tax=Triticum urartu TaxID=4572 RepID=M7YQZ9_TRIUA|nr:hypothetical protein TRIUR3_22943 [Triticum urartu]
MPPSSSGHLALPSLLHVPCPGPPWSMLPPDQAGLAPSRDRVGSVNTVAQDPIALKIAATSVNVAPVQGSCARAGCSPSLPPGRSALPRRLSPPRDDHHPDSSAAAFCMHFPVCSRFSLALRCNFDETRLALEARNNALEKLQQSMLEKEQMLEQIQRSMQSAEEKRHASVSELSAKHRKQLESLEAQLAEVSAERTKASKTIQSLQMVLAEKDSKITGIEAASTGEAARLKATLEEIKGELTHLKDQHEKERQSWEAECESLREKLEALESARFRSEIESAKFRNQLESELSTQNQLLQNKDSDLISAKEEISRLESEFSAYKIRAHALLQRKDAELSAAQNSDVLKAHEEAIREAEKEVAAALEERDEAIQDLQVAQCRHSEEIEARDLGLAELDKKLKNVMKKLDYVTSQFLSEKESWEKKLASVEESWRLKCESMKGQSNGHVEDHLQKNLGEWTLKYEKLKEEHESFRDISDRMIEEKEREIAKLLNANKDLHHSLEAKAAVSPMEPKKDAVKPNFRTPPKCTNIGSISCPVKYFQRASK